MSFLRRLRTKERNNTDGSEIYIFFAMEAIWDGKFIIKLNDKIYKGYSIEDGYIEMEEDGFG